MRFFIAVMGSDAVDDQLGFAVFLGDFRTDRNVSPFQFVVQGLADIVDEPGPFGRFSSTPSSAAMMPAS